MKLTDFYDKQKQEIAETQFVLANFPNAQIYTTTYTKYASKNVNKNFDKAVFFTYHNSLVVMMHKELEYSYLEDNKEQTKIIKVYSLPKRNTLALINVDFSTKSLHIPYPQRQKNIVFTKYLTNLTRHGFNDVIFNDCRDAIIKFIQQHPNCVIDQKNLDPKIKKFMSFI